jgi:hypothetical protein
VGVSDETHAADSDAGVVLLDAVGERDLESAVSSKVVSTERGQDVLGIQAQAGFSASPSCPPYSRRRGLRQAFSTRRRGW